MSVELTSRHCGMKALRITSKHLLALNVLFFFFSEHCTTENGGNISTSTTANWSARKALVILWSAGKTTIILMKNQERLQGDWKMKGTSLFLKTLIQWRNPPLLPPQKIKKSFLWSLGYSSPLQSESRNIISWMALLADRKTVSYRAKKLIRTQFSNDYSIFSTYSWWCLHQP